ncbi:MAG: hypothetical protein KA797_06050 [Chitinophagales bacterium]|nr:hypothetical protein [Chitinophagales bacterium]
MNRISIISPSANPYFNLAAEEYFIRNLDTAETDFFFSYVNEPCLVLGKNQHAYNEVHWSIIQNRQLKIARRISGGGTVYHDQGNLNFCFISSLSRNKINHYTHSTGLIAEALVAMGIPCSMNERNAIVLENGNKITGSAQFTSRTSILSHGTILYKADLDALQKGLALNSAKIVTKSSPSVRSQVENLSENYSNIIPDLKALENQLHANLDYSMEFNWEEDVLHAIEKLQKEKYETPEWIMDKAANGTIQWGDLLYKIDEGFVEINGEKKRFAEIIESMNQGLL